MNRALARVLAFILLPAVLLTPLTIHAADTEDTRFYLGLRISAVTKSHHEDTPALAETLRGNDVAGLTLGVNFNKYLGLEFTVDRYEFLLEKPAGNEVAAYGVSPYLALLRLRYPLFDGRLTPYVLGGGGVGWVQVDDKFPPIGSTQLKKNDFSPVGAVGGGVEYFFANNLAFGLEAKYLFHSAALGVNGQTNRTNLDGLLWGGSLRVYFSEDKTSTGGPRMPSLDADRRRFYLALRTGTFISTHTGISPRGSLDGVQSLHFLSSSLGVNMGRYWGLELSVDSHENSITLQPNGRVGEYTTTTFIPQLRLLYPLMKDSLVPYAVGGVGAGLSEFGDRTPESQGLTFSHAQHLAFVGAAGAGLEYFVLNNVALGVETKYRFFPRATLGINSVDHTVNLNGVLISAGLRIFIN
jgi:opacity protein-like surface antigen